MKEEKCLTYEASQKCQCSFCKDHRRWTNMLIEQQARWEKLKTDLNNLKEKK